MGSQRVAKLPPRKAEEIRVAFEGFHPRSRAAREQAAHVAATAIGPVSKTSSIVQCLSSHSVSDAIGALVGFRSKIVIGGASPQQVFTEYGVQAERPFSKLSDEMLRSLDENLVAQQKSTESANAVHQALPQAILDILGGSRPTEATQEQFHRAFKESDDRKVATTLLTYVISNLISVILDAAGSEAEKSKQDILKKMTREEFSLRLARKINDLAQGKGVLAADIPRHIPEWASEIERFLEKYRA